MQLNQIYTLQAVRVDGPRGGQVSITGQYVCAFRGQSGTGESMSLCSSVSSLIN